MSDDGLISPEAQLKINHALYYGDLEELVKELSYYLHENNLKIPIRFINNLEKQGLIGESH